MRCKWNISYNKKFRLKPRLFLCKSCLEWKCKDSSVPASTVSPATNCNIGSACKVSYVPYRYNKQTMNRIDRVFCPGEQFTLHCLAIVSTLWLCIVKIHFRLTQFREWELCISFASVLCKTNGEWDFYVQLVKVQQETVYYIKTFYAYWTYF